MYSLIRPFCVLVAALIPRSVASGQEADVEVERHFAVPGGGTLAYSSRDGEETSEVFSIRYSGPAEWVVNQKHVRSHWHKIPSLEEVELHMATITPDEVAYIAGLKNVVSLKMSESVFRGRALAPLEHMTWLKFLSLDFGSHLSRLESRSHDLTSYEYPGDDFFKFLAKLTALEVLSLEPNCDEQTFVRICGLKNLKWLNLGKFSKIRDTNAVKIANLSKLEHISFRRLEDPTPFLKALRDHPHLKELWIDGATLDTTDVEFIASMTKLEKLHVRGKRIGTLASLSALTNLTMLQLYFDEVEASDGCRFLASLPNLKELVLSGVDSSDFSIENLRGHRNLKELGISTSLRDDDIAILESMPELKTLGIASPVSQTWYDTAKRRLPNVTIKAVVRRETIGPK